MSDLHDSVAAQDQVEQQAEVSQAVCLSDTVALQYSAHSLS